MRIGSFVLLVCCMMITLAPAAAQTKGGYEYPYSTFNNRDIMKPLIDSRGQILIKEDSDIGNFVLQGIMNYPDGSRAVINGEIVAKGDVFQGYSVKNIEKDKVVLEKDGKDFILKWEGE